MYININRAKIITPPYKRGFTLAETLITLVIIGVVAALTVPTMIMKHQKDETAIRVKKSYSELSQAIHSAEKDYGTLDTWYFADFTNRLERNKYFFENYLKPNFKIMKSCIPTSSECWAEDFKSIDGNIVQNLDSNAISFISVSGISYLFFMHSTGVGGYFFIDINGPKQGPNKQGRDIFVFALNTSHLQPQKGLFLACAQMKNTKLTREELLNGTDKNSDFNKMVCKKGTNNPEAGRCCAALMALDGWQIKDDYPW